MKTFFLFFFTLLFLPFTLVVGAEEAKPKLTGTWEGSLTLSREEMLLAFTFSEVDGQLQAQLTSAGLGIYGMPADSMNYSGLKFQAIFSGIDAEFTGRIRLQDNHETIDRIDGDWFQSAEMVPVSLSPVEEPSF